MEGTTGGGQRGKSGPPGLLAEVRAISHHPMTNLAWAEIRAGLSLHRLQLLGLVGGSDVSCWPLIGVPGFRAGRGCWLCRMSVMSRVLPLLGRTKQPHKSNRPSSDWRASRAFNQADIYMAEPCGHLGKPGVTARLPVFLARGSIGMPCAALYLASSTKHVDLRSGETHDRQGCFALAADHSTKDGGLA